MVQAPDAATVIGGNADMDLAAIEDLARGEYRRGVQEVMSREFVTMYHPDGTSSIVQLPPLPKDGRPQGKALQERQQKILHYSMHMKKDGKQWWFASPPPDWTPTPLPYRCPVESCTRAGGLPDLLNLWRHIQQKHPGEVELYAGVMAAIKTKLENAIPVDLQKLLDTEPATISEGDKAADEAVAAYGDPVGEDTFVAQCGQCGKVAPEDHENAEAWLRGHTLGAHKEGA